MVVWQRHSDTVVQGFREGGGGGKPPHLGCLVVHDTLFVYFLYGMFLVLFFRHSTLFSSNFSYLILYCLSCLLRPLWWFPKYLYIIYYYIRHPGFCKIYVFLYLYSPITTFCDTLCHYVPLLYIFWSYNRYHIRYFNILRYCHIVGQCFLPSSLLF